MKDIYSVRKVFATREGLQGHRTASGFVIPSAKLSRQIPFVALPDTRALGLHVLIYNPLNGFETIATVLDVGPHFTDDADYVFENKEPRAQAHTFSNPSGIDLGETVWMRLGMKDNGPVEWRFLIDSYLLRLVRLW